ncbi:MAG: SUMF1/EgtB/PvdO family nonheme iron enzyme [Pirellulales bacterium]|nr:SUMF1/EgtB/PvdO family nonheme iron enzyme [Pirellulales bacterium]
MSNDSCPSQELLFGYLVGTIPEAEADRIAAHLAACAGCEQTIQALEKRPDTMVSALRQRVPHDAHPPEAQLREIQNRLRNVRPGRNDPAPPNPNPAAQVNPRARKRLGDYELLKKLGQGGMGEVYQAQHTRLNRLVALKVLTKSRFDDPEAVARFEREMKAVGRLDHPNIVRALDARKIGPTHLLVMEYVDGLDLAQIVRFCGPLKIPDACEVIRQAAEGLRCSQEHDLVHRDLKPSNLMLSSSGQVKILDLGLAQIQQAESMAGHVTGVGQVMGTPDYMSPEQALESHKVDIRTDIYSLGCTLYHLLAGHPPFGGSQYDTPMKKVAAHLRDEIRPIALVRPDVPKALAAVLDRMLARDPAARLLGPAALVDAIAPLCEGSKLIGLLTEARRKESAAEESQSPAIQTGQLQGASEVDTSRDESEMLQPVRGAAGAADFDVYHRWLGIPPNEQPADYYRLLGLAKFETDPEVIRDAASRQMAHVRTYHLGQHAELSQRILNELAAARACLLNPAKKAAYDASLREKMHNAGLPTPPSQRTAGSPVASPSEDEGAVNGQMLSDLAAIRPVQARRLRRKLSPATRVRALLRRVPPYAWIAVGCAAGVLLLGVIIYVTTGKGMVKFQFEPSEPNATVVIKVDGDQIDVEGLLKDPLRLSVGEHTLKVASADFEIQAPESFTIRRGKQELVEIKLLPKGKLDEFAGITAPSVEDQSKTKPPAAWPPGSPVGQRGAPPPAIAPFDEKKAKEHQEAWAKHLSVPVEMTNSIGMKMVLIPPGEFMMGSPKELIEQEMQRAQAWLPNFDAWYRWYTEHVPGEAPLHRVRITRPYWLGVAEVTQEEYQRVMGSNPSGAQGDPKRPVERVTWDEAVEFCRRLSELPGEKEAKRRYHLPTEAQWEHACRAGSAGPWCFFVEADALPQAEHEKLLAEYAWFNVFNPNSGWQPSHTHPVAQKRLNAWGLYDIHGNVWEWCADWYNPVYYSKSPTDDPPGPTAGVLYRVARGGCCGHGCGASRSAYRLKGEQSTTRSGDWGFRVLCDFEPDAGAPPAPYATVAGLTILNKCPGKLGPQRMESWGKGRWKDDDQLYWNALQAGDRLEIALAVEKAGAYDVHVALTKAGDYVIVQFNVDGEKAGQPIDLYDPNVVPTGPISLGRFDLSAGEHKLTVEVVGINPKSGQIGGPGYGVGIDQVIVQPATPTPDSQWIDLLTNVDLKRHLVAGSWKQEAGELVATRSPVSRIMLPAVVEGSYDLEVEFTRTMGVREIDILFPVQWQTGTLGLSYPVGFADASGKTSGATVASAFATIDGWYNNRTANPLATGRKYNVRLAVRPGADKVTLQAFIDGKLDEQIETDMPRICTFTGQASPQMKRAELCAYDSEVVFHRIRIRPVGDHVPTPGAVRPLAPGEECREPFVRTAVAGQSPGGKHGRFGRFVDAAPDGGHLIGFRMLTSESDAVILQLQPIYRAAQQTSAEGFNYGVFVERRPDRRLSWRRPSGWKGPAEAACEEHVVAAKEGYAVGTVRVAGLVRGPGDQEQPGGLQVVFMRLKGDRLDPQDSYESRWVGSSKEEWRLDSGGLPIIGVYGVHAADGLIALGLLLPLAESAPILPLAVAPFDENKAKEHQAACANHLGVPVEITNSIGMKLVLIPAGEFDMGCTDEEVARAKAEFQTQNLPPGWLYMVLSESPRHHVRITKPFLVGAYEVTQEDYLNITGKTPSYFSAGGRGGEKVGGLDTRRHPVEQVTWEQAVEFCKILSGRPDEQSAGRVYRLPTEAEWEYACHAGMTTRWHCGEDLAKLESVGWFQTNSDIVTHPVGTKAPNAWGLFDMHGNVLEWCADWFGQDYYRESPRDDPTGPLDGGIRVIRGGSCHEPSVLCRATTRMTLGPQQFNSSVGFRVVCEVRVQPTAGVYAPAAASARSAEEIARRRQEYLDKYLKPLQEGKREDVPESRYAALFPPKVKTQFDLSQIGLTSKVFADWECKSPLDPDRLKDGQTPFFKGYFDTQGRLHQVESYGPNGGMVNEPQKGCAAVRYWYGAKNRRTQETFLGADGKSVDNRFMEVIVHYAYDDADRKVESRFYDKDGKPAEDFLGVHRRVYREGTDALEYRLDGTPRQRWLPAIKLGKWFDHGTTHPEPAISADGKDLYFCADRLVDGTRQRGIFHMKWVDQDHHWSEPEPVLAGGKLLRGRFPAVSSNGNFLAVCALRNDPSHGQEYPDLPNYGGEDVYVTERQGDAWGAVRNGGPKLNDTRRTGGKGCWGLCFAPGTDSLCFVANHLFWLSDREGIEWSEPRRIPVEVIDIPCMPALAVGGKQLYYQSGVQESRKGLGVQDIWMCRKEQNGWARPINLGREVNGGGTDASPTVTADGSIMYYLRYGWSFDLCVTGRADSEEAIRHLADIHALGD